MKYKAINGPKRFQSVSLGSEYTEETASDDEIGVPVTVSESPKKMPAKKSFFKSVGELMTGQSTSDESSVSAHMRKPPKKYYGKANTVSTEAESDPSL